MKLALCICMWNPKLYDGTMETVVLYHGTFETVVPWQFVGMAISYRYC